MTQHAGIESRQLRSPKFPLEDNWYHARQRAARGEGSRDLMLDVLSGLRRNAARRDGDSWANVELRLVREMYPGIHPLIFSGLLAALQAEGVYSKGRVELETFID